MLCMEQIRLTLIIEMANDEFKKKKCEKFRYRRGHRQPQLLRPNMTVSKIEKETLKKM